MKTVNLNNLFYEGDKVNMMFRNGEMIYRGVVKEKRPPVLKIAGQTVPGVWSDGSNTVCGWDFLEQYSATSFTIEYEGETVTATTWTHLNISRGECWEDTSFESGFDTSTFSSICTLSSVYWFLNDNSVEFDTVSEDNDPGRACTECEGLCWDEATYVCSECGDDDEDNCYNWSDRGYSSWEECRCAEYGDMCDDVDDCGGDPECECYQNGGEWDGENCN